jgi:hypothetical protein
MLIRSNEFIFFAKSNFPSGESARSTGLPGRYTWNPAGCKSWFDGTRILPFGCMPTVLEPKIVFCCAIETEG